MTKTYYTDAELAALLRAMMRRSGKTQKEWARQAKIGEAYLSDFLRGRRGAGPTILKAMGFEKGQYFRRSKP